MKYAQWCVYLMIDEYLKPVICVNYVNFELMKLHTQVIKLKVCAQHAVGCVSIRVQHAYIEAQVAVNAQISGTVSARVCCSKRAFCAEISCFRIVACRYSCGVVVVRGRFEGVVCGARSELFDEDCGLIQHSKTAV